jgi:trehalose monomycolate/heme transporter
MFQWIARQVVGGRLAVLIAAGAFVVAGILWGTSAFGRLAAGGFDDPGSQSALAAQRIATELGQHAPDVLVRYSSPTATVDGPAFRDAVLGVESRLRARPAVSAVTGYYDGANQRFVSAGRHATYLAIQLKATDDSQRRAAFETIKQDLTAPGLTSQAGGDVAVQAAGDDVTKRDVARGEMFAFPVVLLLLAIIFGSLVAALMPLLVGIVAILGALTATRAIESVTTVSTFAINTITLLGLGMAVDYALIVISRYREQLRLGDSPQDAARHTILTAGRTVVISGLTVTLSLASMLVFPEVFLHSMAFGGMSAVFIAMVTSLTVLPAALAMLGHRINALPVRRRAIAVLRTRGEQDGAWARIARAVMRRPASYATAVVVVLAVLALPVLHLRFGGFDERVLPADSGPRVAAESLARDFPGLAGYPVEVLAEGASAPQAAHLEGVIRALPGVSSVTVAAVRQGHALLQVSYRGEPGAASTQALVGEIRALPAPPGMSILVAGPPAELADQLHSLAAGLPWMLLVMALVTLVLLFLAFGSVVLPVKAVLVNALSVGAAFGILVWGFQYGHLSGILRFTATSYLEPTTLVLILALLFGLATDYEVFLLSRVREEWARGGDNTAAVAKGLQRTGGLITAAALLLGVVTAGFASGQLVIAKLIGVGMVAGLALDAVLVRMILVPATMRLLGRWNWWLPAPLAAVYRRLGLQESSGYAGEAAALDAELAGDVLRVVPDAADGAGTAPR